MNKQLNRQLQDLIEDLFEEKKYGRVFDALYIVGGKEEPTYLKFWWYNLPHYENLQVGLEFHVEEGNLMVWEVDHMPKNIKDFGRKLEGTEKVFTTLEGCVEYVHSQLKRSKNDLRW